ncbi:MAG: tRNA (N6-isopentenyl adenosine(37)-C2)-methylthiotransferase MiaB [Verrucomicrobiales bacterium]|jgi:tRNA-2-methylthio-N6-dimethylallyladenosine synthase|nr:tRNA (N6-isopentenyl adenosine(37)-C2)-methylthiotransferase MiaB [Verrucomicrobiales bacterium]
MAARGSKFFIKTYGCQMNERDSEQVAVALTERGYAAADREADADIVLLNTCSVRDMAEQKAIARMQSLQGRKRRNPALIIGFMGCMAQSRGGELAKLAPQVDLIVGTQKYHKVADYVDRLLARRNPDMDDLRGAIVDIAEEPGSQNAIKDHPPMVSRATAFVSIMQGCNMRCAFCIVPFTRGAERSRPIADIVSEARALAAGGVKEITLLGQIVNQYGRHEFPAVSGRTPFTQLLYALEEIDGLERIRFTSPHPIGYKRDLLQAFRELPKLCEHIHLPLQSGSDRILKAMRRAYTAGQYRRLVADIRAARPDMAITTDIIVGFPGETDADYDATRRLVEEVRFDNAFIFRYSERRGTPAAALPDQVAGEVRDFRNKDLLGVIDVIAADHAAALLGRTVEILVEGPSRTKASRSAGRTRTNKPVIISGGAELRGKIIPVKITDHTNFTFYGEPV